jgi:predicted acetyltransferase
MAELSLPTVTVHASFLAAVEELRGEGRGEPDDDTMLGREVRRFAGIWATSEGFSEYVEALRADSAEEAPRPSGFVPSTTFWWVEGDEYLGRIAVRHRLTERLLEIGGHIGYDVRPSARRRGHATAMLAAVLPEANALGIDPALVTCDTSNVASRKVIEANGGVLEDERSGKLRFWVATGRGRATS